MLPFKSHVGDLGWTTVSGRVTNTSRTPIPNALVTCSHFSYFPRTLCSGTRTTDANGNYSFGSVFLHDTDSITVRAEAAGYQPQTIQRSGLDTWYSPVFNFALTP